MLSLTRAERQATIFEGRLYRLSLSFDRVLLFYELLDDAEAEDIDKLQIGLKLLVKGNKWSRLPLEQQSKLLTAIYNEHIKSDKPASKNKAKTMDYTEDAGYIFASFFYAYRIDLHKEKGRMSWARFTALMDGLPEQSKMREVINIRTMDVPKPDKYNGKERASILDAKRYHALQGVQQMDYQAGLDALFTMAEGMAERRD